MSGMENWKRAIERFRATKEALHKQQCAEIEDLGAEDKLWNEHDLATSDITDRLSQLLDYVDELERQRDTLRAFMEKVGMASDARNMELTTANGEDDVGEVMSAYIHTLDNVGREAWDLLAKLEKIKNAPPQP